MKSIPLIIASLLALPFFVKAQLNDTGVSKKLTVNGFCLCKTTLESLKQSDADLKEIDVQEMDLAKGRLGQDSRFIAGKSYASYKQPKKIVHLSSMGAYTE